jgi:PAS domain S-box-containing protein
LDRYVYRSHANYRRTVKEASEELTRVLNLKALLAFICQTVTASTQADAISIYLRKRRGFTKTVSRRHHEDNPFEVDDSALALIVLHLTTSRDALVTEELPRKRESGERNELYHALTAANWALVLPVLSEDAVIGIIALGPKLSGDPYYPQDFDLLMTLANQAGIAIKNAQLYAEVVLANEYIENIVATIESGVIAISDAGEVAMFNRAAEQMTGLSAQDVKGRPASVLPACLREGLVASVADGQQRTEPEIELPNVVADVKPKPVICTTSPLRDPTGSVLGAVTVFSDLTPLKELEIERRRAERLAYFEVLASGIGHEIKNPLVAIKTFAQLLPRRHHDERFVEDFGKVVTREIGRMESLVDRLRTLSRPGERPRHPLDLRGPLGEALEFLQPAFDDKGVALVSTIADGPCVVLGDHAELSQVFLNLLLNAQEATPNGGRVDVELSRGDHHVRFVVADTGPGIAAELLERVFDPFFTTKDHGSGLGLAICAGIAQAHGARLRAENRPTGGAIFSLEFPVAAASSIPA